MSKPQEWGEVGEGSCNPCGQESGFVERMSGLRDVEPPREENVDTALILIVEENVTLDEIKSSPWEGSQLIFRESELSLHGVIRHCELD